MTVEESRLSQYAHLLIEAASSGLPGCCTLAKLQDRFMQVGHELSAAELVKLVEEALQAGLIHLSVNSIENPPQFSIIASATGKDYAQIRNKSVTEAQLRKDILLAINDDRPPLSTPPPWSSYEEISMRLGEKGHKLTEAELLHELRKLAGDRHEMFSTFIQLDEGKRRAQLMLQGMGNLAWLLENT